MTKVVTVSGFTSSVRYARVQSVNKDAKVILKPIIVIYIELKRGLTSSVRYALVQSVRESTSELAKENLSRTDRF